MYMITNYKETKKGIDINGAKLYLIADDLSDAKEVLEFQHTTDKGWKSKKAIKADFDYVVNKEELACSALQISDDIAAELIAQYQAVTVKTFSTWRPDSKAAGILAMCEYMHDPYDQSGSFSDESLSKGH